EVVDRRHRDVELAVDEIGQLEHRARRGGDFHFEAVLGEESFFLRDPDRPVEAPRKDDHVDDPGRCGRGGRRHRERGGGRRRGRGGRRRGRGGWWRGRGRRRRGERGRCGRRRRNARARRKERC